MANHGREHRAFELGLLKCPFPQYDYEVGPRSGRVNLNRHYARKHGEPTEPTETTLLSAGQALDQLLMGDDDVPGDEIPGVF